MQAMLAMRIVVGLAGLTFTAARMPAGVTWTDPWLKIGSVSRSLTP